MVLRVWGVLVLKEGDSLLKGRQKNIYSSKARNGKLAFCGKKKPTVFAASFSPPMHLFYSPQPHFFMHWFQTLLRYYRCYWCSHVVK